MPTRKTSKLNTERNHRFNCQSMFKDDAKRNKIYFAEFMKNLSISEPELLFNELKNRLKLQTSKEIKSNNIHSISIQRTRNYHRNLALLHRRVFIDNHQNPISCIAVLSDNPLIAPSLFINRVSEHNHTQKNKISIFQSKTMIIYERKKKISP